MKQILTYTSMLVLLLASQGGSDAFAKGPAGVANGLHNLSGSAPAAGGYATDESEICVFCHTPHGAAGTGPLWNKPNAAGPFTHYTTDTPDLVDPNRVLSDQSKLCMSCHDGITSVNTVINLPNSRTLPIETNMSGSPDNPMIPGWGAVNPVLDTDLSNDHPISFSYDNVLTHYTNNSLTGLDTVANAIAEGVRFFGPSNFVECSTCHDPHVDYTASGDVAYTPFLITPNAGSNLCLACHTK